MGTVQLSSWGKGVRKSRSQREGEPRRKANGKRKQGWKKQGFRQGTVDTKSTGEQLTPLEEPLK